jgi:hypothetical protein
MTNPIIHIDENTDTVRDISGETVMGMRVAAWRWEVGKPADCTQEKWESVFPSGAGYQHASHWSTGPDDAERLFAEKDVRALYDQLEVLKAEASYAMCRPEGKFGIEIGPSYHFVHNGKYKAVHTSVIRDLMTRYAGTDVADTIAALSWWRDIDGERERFLLSDSRDTILSLQSELDEKSKALDQALLDLSEAI